MVTRRLPIGAEVQDDGGVHFRVWAPRRRVVEVVLEGEQPVAVRLEAEPDGYFAGAVRETPPGSLYRFRLDGEKTLFPDPASRYQPQGVHGPSQVIDPRQFEWTDRGWPGVTPRGQVLYEMHVGTFTPAGTWEAATHELMELADLGVTVVSVMPVAEFPGWCGWGYDGVDLFAPTRLYGEPDDFRRFVDRAHAVGLGVVLDVVYNHLGPDGNYLGQFSQHYVHERNSTEWGEAINFDGERSGPVREFFITNASYWVEEFHVDGLRFDATHRIYDDSSDHILAAITRRVREAAKDRSTLLIAEADHQDARIARPVERGGFGLDAIWNDDFHHSARVALTGHNESYYSRYQGSAQELVSAVKWGFLYQGQRSRGMKTSRGTPAFDLPAPAFVTFLENHDQVSCSADGRRLHALSDPGSYRAMTALLLLGGATPMLFQGQEFASSSPFLFFADHNQELAKLVAKGRADFLCQFPSIATIRTRLLSPEDPMAFQRSKLDPTERKRNTEAYSLHRDLLRLRREHAALQRCPPHSVDGAVLGSEAFVLRFFAGGDDDRLLLVNLGRDLELVQASEPLLAAPEGTDWKLAWSSEDPRYGGSGTAPIHGDDGWRLPGHAAVVLSVSPRA